MHRPFALSDSLTSSVAVSVFTEKKTTCIEYKESFKSLNIQFDNKKENEEKISKKRKKIWKYFIISLLLSIPLSIILIVRCCLYCSTYIINDFPKNFLWAITDENHYQLITLENHIKLALIANPQCVISSFIVTIAYGTANDPSDLLGLSHLALKTKMTLILGIFINEHINQIKHFNMSYFINEEVSHITVSIENQFLWKCLNHLVNSINSQDSPSDLLLEEALEGINRKSEELNAVNARNQIINSILYKKENYIGDYNTLGNDKTVYNKLRTNLNEAIKMYYIGNNIKIVIETNEPMNILIEKSDTLFKTISCNIPTIQLNSLNVNIIQYTNIRRIIWIKTTELFESMKLIFIIPDLSKIAMICYEYLSYLINRHGSNSFCKNLFSLHLCSDVQSKITKVLSTHIQFEFTFKLLSNSTASLGTFIQKLFAYVSSLKKLPFNQGQYNEFVSLKKNSFILTEESQYDRITRLMKYLTNDLSYDDYLSFNSLSYQVTNEQHNYLIPEHSLIIHMTNNVLSKRFFLYENYYIADLFIEQRSQKKYYSLMYQPEFLIQFKEVANDDFIIEKDWEPNTFIIQSSQNPIKYDKDKYPTEMNEMEPNIIYQTNYSTIWHRLDRSFKLPKVIAYINIISPYLRTKVYTKTYIDLIFFKCFQKQIMDKLSLSIEAGNSIDIKHNDNGFTIIIESHSDSIWKIIDIITDAFHHPVIDYIIVEEQINETHQLEDIPLSQKGMIYFRKIIKYNHPIKWSFIPLSMNLIEKGFADIISNSTMTSLYYGNIHKEDLLHKINDYASTYPNDKANVLPEFSPYHFQHLYTSLHKQNDFSGSYVFYFTNNYKYENNHLIENYYKLGKKTDNLIAEANILKAMIIDIARCFLLLGNKRAIDLIIIDDIVYYKVYVEHEKISPDLLDKHLDIIIETLETRINLLTVDVFQGYKNKVLFDQRITYNSLSHKAHLVWNEIYRNTLEFRRKTISTFINKYSFQNLIDFYQRVFFKEQTVKKISIQLFKHSPNIPLYIGDNVVKYRLNPQINTIITSDINILRANIHDENHSVR